jgi:hypothetical protein
MNTRSWNAKGIKLDMRFNNLVKEFAVNNKQSKALAKRLHAAAQACARHQRLAHHS